MIDKPKTPDEIVDEAHAAAEETRGLVARAKRIIEELQSERQKNHFAPALAEVMRRKSVE